MHWNVVNVRCFSNFSNLPLLNSVNVFACVKHIELHSNKVALSYVEVSGGHKSWASVPPEDILMPRNYVEVSRAFFRRKAFFVAIQQHLSAILNLYQESDNYFLYLMDSWALELKKLKAKCSDVKAITRPPPTLKCFWALLKRSLQHTHTHTVFTVSGSDPLWTKTTFSPQTWSVLLPRAPSSPELQLGWKVASQALV